MRFDNRCMSPKPPNMTDPATDASRYCILGTAGHIDHGKTSLVRALTGTNTDRLPEERRRGMTIELGFAELTVGSVRFGIVDVPGHERFVRTMVAGATGIDVALIVIAADDSVMPQTIEHVEILHLLGVSHGVVAITKTDMVDHEMVELVGEEVRELLAGTALEHAPICPVSSITQSGLDDLRSALIEACASVPTIASAVPFRMAVDRVFTVQGRGTVATGSVLRGAVAEGDSLTVWPGGHSCRVRGLQSHGCQSGGIERGQRAAINVSGVDRAFVVRGSELATPGYLSPTRIFDVRLQSLRGGRPLKSASVVRFEIGTEELPARVILFDGDRLEPGDSAYAQLRVGSAVAATYGQRFIIRDENAARTIGGGVVLRMAMRRRRRSHDEQVAGMKRLDHGDDADRLEEVLRSAWFTRPDDLTLCAHAGIELTDIPASFDRLRSEGRWTSVAGTDIFAVPDVVAGLNRRVTAWLTRYHKANPDLPGRPADAVIGYLERMTLKSLARPLLDEFVDNGTLKRFGRFICLPEFAPALSAADEKLLAAMVAEVRAGGFQPPRLEDINVSPSPGRKQLARMVTLAVAMGELVAVDEKTYLHAEVEQQLRDRLTALIEEQGGISVGEVREALDSTRKFVVPFLEYLDRVGFTKRVGDKRELNSPRDG